MGESHKARRANYRSVLSAKSKRNENGNRSGRVAPQRGNKAMAISLGSAGSARASRKVLENLGLLSCESLLEP